jgi:hypothetical protein
VRVAEHELPIAGRNVSSLALSRFTPFLRLHFWGHEIDGSTPGPDFTFEIEGPFRLSSNTTTTEVDPETAIHPVVLDLMHKQVERALAFDDGTAVIEFVDGAVLTVPPDQYEAWQLNGDSGELFVSVAGGGLAIWGAD